MKTTILAMVAAMAVTGSNAIAQTNSAGTANPPPASMAPTNSPPPGSKGIDTDGTGVRAPAKLPSEGATGAISPTSSGFPSATDDKTPSNGDPNSPGQKNGSGKAGGGSK
ncbi:MAG: hypothetical protein JWO51_1974 [Rhodospirillales bacterium]|nr:hypothetical protein [Rhodospirillales bacterium]